MAEATRERIGVTREIRVIPNFVDTEIYQRGQCELDRKVFAPDDEPIIVHVSNMRPVKRLGDLMTAFIKLRRRMKAKMLLVGDGPERARVEMQAHRGGVLDDVLFLGNQMEIREILSIADVYCLPSETESFGLSALEAMACEVPVVASRVGGLPEVVADGECGYLVECGNTEELSQRLWELCANRELARAMGRAARARAVELFPRDKIVSQYESLYCELTKGDRQ